MATTTAPTSTLEATAVAAAEAEAAAGVAIATSRRRAVLACLCTAVLLAAPLWWSTTRVVRAPIPSARIALHATRWAAAPAPADPALPPLRFVAAVDVAVAAGAVAAGVDPALVSGDVERRVNNVFRPAADGADSAAARFVPAVEVVGRVVADEDAWAPKPSQIGAYSLLVACGGGGGVDAPPSISILHDRRAVIRLQSPCSQARARPPPDDVAAAVASTLSGIFAGELVDLARESADPDADHGRTRPDHDAMRKAKFATEYELTLSLFNAEPSSLNVDWEIGEALRAYLDPFVEQVSVLHNFSVASQIQHYTTLPIAPERFGAAPDDVFILRPHHLPLFVDSAEWNFGGQDVVETS
ncbi:hypothetical protein HK405_014635 [Cladochytrium tenue]|nr:hypothetical protein HK405_014635 [Cladochytrium tenue]